MTRPRVPETDQGIQGEFNVTVYDQMQRRLRDKGWIETNELINHGITQGCALEVGPGPGYLGLEWLKRTQGTTLKGLDISPDMIALAERNAGEYGLPHRVEYIRSNDAAMLQRAALGTLALAGSARVAVLGGEGLAAVCLTAADVVVPSIEAGSNNCDRRLCDVGKEIS